MLSATELNRHWAAPDEDVRDHVRDFFVKSVDPVPATMDDFWAGIDAAIKSTAGDDGLEAIVLSRLGNRGRIPWTATSIERFVAEIESSDHSFAVHDKLRTAFIEMDLRELSEHRDLIFSKLARDKKVLREVKKRFELLERPPEVLWRELDLATAPADKDLNLSPDQMHINDLLSAMRPHGERLAALAMNCVEDSKHRFWLQLASLRFLGLICYRPAVGAILDLLKASDETDDWLFEEAPKALAQAGGNDALKEFQAFYSTAPRDARNVVVNAIGLIKTSDAEQLLMRLADVETDSFSLSEIGFALCSLFPTDGAEIVDQMIREEKYDLGVVELHEELSTVAKLTGFHSETLDRWAKLTEAERRQRFIDKTPEEDEMRAVVENLKRLANKQGFRK